MLTEEKKMQLRDETLVLTLRQLLLMERRWEVIRAYLLATAPESEELARGFDENEKFLRDIDPKESVIEQIEALLLLAKTGKKSEQSDA